MERKRRSIWLALVVTVSLVLPLSGVSEAHDRMGSRASSLSPEYDSLVQRAREDGMVRVLVGLELPIRFRPEGDLGSPAAIQSQRAAIAEARQELFDRLSQHSVDTYAVYNTIPYVALEIDAVGLEALVASPLVASIQQDRAVPAALASSTAVIGASNVWAQGFDGTGQNVVILDTGIQRDHPFVKARVVDEACFSHHDPSVGVRQYTLCPGGGTSEFGTGAADATTDNCWDDGSLMCDHGMHVAGIAAGKDDAGNPGYNGVAPGAGIIAIQVFTRFERAPDCGGGQNAPCIMSFSSDQISALEYVYTTLRHSHQIASINMSLGGGEYTDQATCDADNSATRAMIDNLRSVGIATVIASGNAYWTDAMEAPGCISSAIGVGATTDADEVASFSNMHDMMDLLAPGVSIDSSVPVSTYATFQGTSMATPHVAGAWAILKSIDPDASVDEILIALQDTGVSVTDGRPGGSITKPRIQLDAAVMTVRPTIWEGNHGSSWSDVGNWSSGRVPSRFADVIIPATPEGEIFPVIDADAEVGNLVIETEAQLGMSANTLSVYENWDVQGTGHFDATGGTVVFGGSLTQTISMTAGTNGQFFGLQIGGSTSPIVLLSSDLDVNGDLEILSGALLDGGNHILRVAGDWTDSGDGFVGGSSTVILNGTTQDFQKVGPAPIEVYSNNLSDTAGWTLENVNGDDRFWYYADSTANPNLPYSGQHARYSWHVSNEANDWLFSPPFALKAGKTYTITFNYGARSSSYPERLGVSVGMSNDSAGMTTDFFDDNYVDHTSWQQGSGVFSPSRTGVYYVGFHAYSLADRWELAVDDLVVQTVRGPFAFHNLVIGSTDRVVFGSDVLVQNDLTVTVGSVMDIGTNSLVVDGIVTNSGGLRQSQDVLNAALTPFLRVLDAGGTIAKYYGVDIYPTSGDMGSTTVTVYGNQPCPRSGAAVQRCFEISPTTPQTADVKFYYREAEENEQTAAQVWHWSGSAWEPQTFGGRDLSGEENNWVKATGVTSYSPFALSNEMPTVVRLASLSARPDGDHILVAWETATELGNLGFNLYRSQAIDGEYVKISEALIPSQSPGTVLGAVYTWRDRDILPGVTYYYVLEDVDIYGVRTLHGPLQAVLTLYDILIYLPVVSKGH